VHSPNVNTGIDTKCISQARFFFRFLREETKVSKYVQALQEYQICTCAGQEYKLTYDHLQLSCSA